MIPCPNLVRLDTNVAPRISRPYARFHGPPGRSLCPNYTKVLAQTIGKPYRKVVRQAHHERGYLTSVRPEPVEGPSGYITYCFLAMSEGRG